MLEYKKGEHPSHCSPCFLVAKPGSTALRFVLDYGELNKRTQNHFGSLPNMEHTLERISSCCYKTKMDKRILRFFIFSRYFHVFIAFHCCCLVLAVSFFGQVACCVRSISARAPSTLHQAPTRVPHKQNYSAA